MKYLIDTHTHTIASGHAYNTIDECSRHAAEIGLSNLAITEHAPKMPGSCHTLYFSNLKVLPRKKFGIKRIFGCEVNIMNYDGKLDLSEGILSQMEIVIASMHIPCVKPGTMEENTKAFVKCIENPLVDIIGHPDDSRYPVDYDVLVNAAAANNKILELNNNSLNPDGPRQNARENDIEMLKLCKKHNVFITLSSDAHTEEAIGRFENCERLIEEVDFPERLIANLDLDRYVFLNNK